MIDRLICLSAARGGLPVAFQKCLDPENDGGQGFLKSLAPHVNELMLLNTCERFEFYLVRRGVDSCSSWLEQLAHLDLAAPWDGIKKWQRFEAHAAVRHLHCVAGGLKSRILGEEQILGQVRRAYAQAMERGLSGPLLSALGRSAIHAGKRIRNETALNQTRCSWALAVTDWLTSKFADFRSKSFLVLGTGSLASDVLEQLRKAGVEYLTVMGRNPKRTSELANEFFAEAADIKQLSNHLSCNDVIITCTSSSSWLLDATMIKAGRAIECSTGRLKRESAGQVKEAPVEQVAERHLEILDLGVPPNIDPRVSELPLVRLRHLHELVPESDAAPELIIQAETIIDQEIGRFAEWVRARRVSSSIADLLEHTSLNESGNRDSREFKKALHRRIQQIKESVAA